MSQDPAAISGNQRDHRVTGSPKLVDELGFGWPSECHCVHLMNCRLITHGFVSDNHLWKSSTQTGSAI
jgi:hypothetical protein